MRTSLNNIKAIDDYLSRRMAPGEVLLFEAKLLLDNDLKDDIQHQQSTYLIIRQYSRRNIKAEILAVQETLASAPQYRGFMQRIADLFRKP